MPPPPPSITTHNKQQQSSQSTPNLSPPNSILSPPSPPTTNHLKAIFPPGITRSPSPGFKNLHRINDLKSKNNTMTCSSNNQQQQYPDYLKMILTAPIYDVVKETPITLAERLSARLGNTIYLKREDMQPIFSFKIRGAYNRLKSLTEEERTKGVVAASAGNHAQGVALAAKKLGIKATIVMPTTAPEIKSENVRRLGGDVLFYGVDLQEAKLEAARLEHEFGYINIPAFDDPFIIAGQGTCAVEILRQVPAGKLDAIFVCCGGGGLLAGIATYVKRLYENVKVIGVEQHDQNSMSLALAAGKPVTMTDIDLFADGTAVRRVGDETFRLVKENVDEMVLVSNDEICAAIKDVFIDTRSVIEPSGALALAGCKRWVADNNVQNGVFVSITSGSNIGFDRLQFVSERAELGEETEALISVLMPERPGSFLGMLQTIMPLKIRELSYRYHRTDCAHVFASIRVRGDVGRDVEVRDLLEKLAVQDMSGVDISKNEFAKSHARYLVGGRTLIKNERLVSCSYRSAGRNLPDILAHFSPDYNQLLFHYKDLGGDVVNVLMGFDVPMDMANDFNQRLSRLSSKLGVAVTEETDNVVYNHFFRD